jgi:hypothetical protein
VAVLDDNPAGGQPLSYDVLQGLGHGSRAFTGPDNDDFPKAVQGIGMFPYPQTVALPGNVAADGFFRIDGLEAGHKDPGEDIFEVLIHAYGSCTGGKPGAPPHHHFKLQLW